VTGDVGDYEAQIPNLTRHKWRCASKKDPSYNCIAWAAGDTTRNWWPPSHLGAVTYWPPGILAFETLAAFIQAFETLGYEVCDHPGLEVGMEKVAIFVSARTGAPTHAARQLPSGQWTSKLGAGIDIVHDDLEAVGGEMALEFGSVAAVLVRPGPSTRDSMTWSRQ